jgi:TrmH family RNA methyltransferase
VRSPQNRRVVEAVKLHRRRGRRAAGLALLEGPHVVGEAVAAGATVVRVFYEPGDEAGRTAAERCGAEAVIVTPGVLKKLSTTLQPQSPIGVAVIPEAVLPDAGDVLAAWGVGDPGNLGTLIRIAAAVGLFFAAGPGSADPWSPKVLRAAAGGHFRTVVANAATLADLGPRTLVATVPSGGVPPTGLPEGHVAILVGDEASGLPNDVVERSGCRVTIAMPGGMESLNAALAGAIVAYEASRRGGAGRVMGSH